MTERSIDLGWMDWSADEPTGGVPTEPASPEALQQHEVSSKRVFAFLDAEWEWSE